MKQKNLRKNTGITLVALIITIIVLLILSVLSIQEIVGDGIITKAKNANLQYAHATVKEALILAHSEYTFQQYISSKKIEGVKLASLRMASLGDTSEKITFLEFLSTKGYIKEDTEGTIDTEKLLGEKQSVGNGTEDSNVYKLETDGINYVLNYYDNEGNISELGEICPVEDTTITPPSITYSNLDVTLAKEGSNSVKLTISKITEVECPISIDYYIMPPNFSPHFVDGITLEESQVTNGSATITFDYIEALSKEGFSDISEGTAIVGIVDGLGLPAKIMYLNEETGVLEDYNNQISFTK